MENYHFKTKFSYFKGYSIDSREYAYLAFNFSKSAIETSEQNVKSVQS